MSPRLIVLIDKVLILLLRHVVQYLLPRFLLYIVNDILRVLLLKHIVEDVLTLLTLVLPQ